MSDHDVIVAGSGLAGLTAGLVAARHGLKTLVMEANVPGGHLISIEKIEDFPGFPDGIAGYDLCPTVQRQAADFGAEFQRAEVESLKTDDRFWQVLTSAGPLRAKAVIIATGSTVKALGVPGEERLTGRGVSHCASCDGPLYQGKIVGVAGGGDSALQEAMTLAAHADQVIILTRDGDFTAQQTYRERIHRNVKIVARRRTVVDEVLGNDTVTGVRVRDLATDRSSELELSGLFVYAGLQPNTGFLRHLLRLTEDGHVPTNSSMQTELPGLYAAGDIRQESPAQAITSAGEGAAAAIAAYRYIRGIFA